MDEKNIKPVPQHESGVKKNPFHRIRSSPWFMAVAATVVVLGLAGGFYYWRLSSSRIYIEKAMVSAPEIDLAPQGSGILQQLYVHEGDFIDANAPVALVGNELIKSKVAGEIISVNQNVGQLFNRGQTVAAMIDPTELRVIGQVDEDKGLNDIGVGQTAIFTVDAFGSKQYQGVVDEVSPTSHQGDVVFNISDKRQTQQFDVKVRFDISQYPELKNGMSVKLWIYK